MFSSTNPRLQVSSGVSGSSGYDFCSGHRRWGATQPGQLPELVENCWYTPTWEGYWIWLWLWMIDPFWWILNLIVVVDDWSILMYPTEGVSMCFFWGMVWMLVHMKWWMCSLGVNIWYEWDITHVVIWCHSHRWIFREITWTHSGTTNNGVYAIFFNYIWPWFEQN